MISIFAAVIVDALIGDPYLLPHPVRLIGWYIAKFEALTRKIAKTAVSLKIMGVLLNLSTVALAYLIPTLLLMMAWRTNPNLYAVLNIYIMYTCLAARCLRDEGMKIYKKLQSSGLEEARKQTAMIVGRDTDALDEDGITRAVVETISENASDGVVAPLLYMAIGGAPLAMAYKAINTLDSMVGYKNEKYIDFGWFSAKLDDVANYLPARITALLMSFASLFLGLDWKSSLKTVIQDGRNHSSPNSGYPEAATAGALGVQLGGTNYYFGAPVHKPTIGQRTRPLEKKDILASIKLMLGAYVICLLLISLIKLSLG